MAESGGGGVDEWREKLTGGLCAYKWNLKEEEAALSDMGLTSIQAPSVCAGHKSEATNAGEKEPTAQKDYFLGKRP